MELNLEYAQKNEGIYYGDGAAALARRVAEAVAGKSKAREQARAVEKALKAYAAEVGMNPEREVYFRDPKQNKAFGYGDCYAVGLEGGPYDWAIVASEALCQIGVFAEPYYGFDLCFYPAEDR